MLFNKHFTQTFLRPPCDFFSVPAKKRLLTVISLKLCRNALIRSFVVLVIISSFLNTPVYSQESEDSQIFISGFNAYQQKDYPATITRMTEVLQKYPDSALRDMVLFWLSRAYFKSGNQQNAAKYMSQFFKEYPDNPLKGTVDEDLLALTARYDKGEKLVTGSLPVVAQKETAEHERLARQKEEQTRLAAVKAEEDRKVAEKVEQARLAALQKEQERIVAVKAEEARKAVEKAEQERLVALQKEQANKAAVVAEEQRQAREREFAENKRTSKVVLREKAIAQYKSIIEKYPASKAAVAAAAKLKDLGVAVALPQAAAVEQLPENIKVLRYEVAQFAGLEFNLAATSQAYNVARRISIPFEITNRGNGNDSFHLDSGFPAEFAAGFAAASQPEKALNQTTILAPGESFKGVINLVIPPATIDGLRINYPVKAASRLLAEATQSREVSITAAAPLLRAVVKTDKKLLLPGEKAIYRVAVLNVGSTMAQDVSLRLNFPPQMEPVEYSALGFRQEMKSALILDGLQIKSGESKDFSVAFQLKDDSLAGQELLTRAELVNNQLKTAAVFVSNAAHVQQNHGVLVRAAAERQIVIPGQTVYIPFVVTNTGNLSEKFRIAASVTGAQETVIFLDTNRDGTRQANEPVITEVGPLAPKEEASIVMEIKTPRSAADGSLGSAQLIFSADGEPARSASGSTKIVYSRPVLQMAMTAREGQLKPGEVTSFDLRITNSGSSLARIVELQGTWPDQLELVAADPSSSSSVNGNILWKFKEVGAGEKRTIKVSFRVKSGTSVGTNIQVKNQLSYEDQLGNRY
ncbi:MAG: DUF11 domain-containing protein [Desulfuromonadales bacterium]|nr:DUF11 domain-containing protein [Desulfuromonadales bacterium]